MASKTLATCGTIETEWGSILGHLFVMLILKMVASEILAIAFALLGFFLAVLWLFEQDMGSHYFQFPYKTWYFDHMWAQHGSYEPIAVSALKSLISFFPTQMELPCFLLL